MSNGFHTFPNRTLCTVLEEMRTADKNKNYSYLASLIDEVQTLGNRMESALEDRKDVREWSEKRHELKEEIKKLIEERNKLKPKETKDESKD